MTPIRPAIYAITGPRSRMAIGASRDVYPLFTYYRALLRRGRYPNVRLQRAWARYGSNAFRFIVLEHCDVSRLPRRERHWRRHFNVAKGEYKRVDW